MLTHGSTHYRASLGSGTAVIASVASAFPDRSYSQEEIGALLGLENRVVKKLLGSPHIQRRHLYLPEKDPRTGRARSESAADLHAKFREGAFEIGSRAIRDALDAASLSPSDVDYMLCVTSTGFMVPGSVRFFPGSSASSEISTGWTLSGWDATPG
jgi:3,5-dihydroxyphenylacetyl-CoA synthase